MANSTFCSLNACGPYHGCCRFLFPEVTTRDPRDLPYVRECVTTQIKPIPKAGLLPTATHIEIFSDALEEYGLGHGRKNLHKTLLQFNDLAAVQSDYFVCRQTPMVHIAQQLSELDLSIVSIIPRTWTKRRNAI